MSRKTCGKCVCLVCDMPVKRNEEVCHCPLKEGRSAPEDCDNKREAVQIVE